MLINDLDALIGSILREDRQVLRELLTTRKVYVNWQAAGDDIPPQRVVAELGAEGVYGLPPDWRWTPNQPVEIPGNSRSGVLTHPAWLVAWSGNFDNDPVRRGKWIRTHLLGGWIPDVPIGVDANIPRDPQLTLRDRLHDKVSAAECWRCHRVMDKLGLPFEQYTHRGWLRRQELGQAVDTSGFIARTGDPSLDGLAIDDPNHLMHVLSRSERVEQVFVRHAFRYFMGRNETLGDAATLQSAWRAYRSSDGSFRALVTDLLASESFLYRMP